MKLFRRTRKSRSDKGRRIGLVEKAIRRVWRFRLTPAGRVMMGAMLAAGMTCWVTLTVPIYHIFCALAATYLVGGVFALLGRPRLRVSARMPDRAVAGQEVEGVFELTNKARRAAYDVSVGLFEMPGAVRQVGLAATVGRLAAGESASLPVRIRPLRRGLYWLGDALAFTTFPFNLSRNWPIRHAVGPLLVLPRYHRIEGVDMPVGSRYQPGGIALTSNIGESPEYVGSREYRPGDSPRRIDFRSWARLARPVVREYQEEYYCRVALVLDTFVPGIRRQPAGGFKALEAAVSLTASAAEALSRGEHIIDLFAAGPQLYVFRAGRHTAHFENVLEILASVEPSRANPFDKVTPALANELANISAVVFVLLDWDAARRELVRTAVEVGCNTKVVVVRKSRPTEPLDPDESWAGPVRIFAPGQIQRGEVRVL